MKTPFIVMLLFLLCSDHSWSKTRYVPEAPSPKLSVEKVLEIATAKLGKDADHYTVVAVDWCVASEFQPHYTDGSTYSPGGDEPKSYSWFVTYLYHNDSEPKPAQPLNAVLVLRIKDDGSFGMLVSVRT